MAKNDSEDARAVLALSREAGVPVFVPAVVLAESLFGDHRDARANRALKKLQVVPVSESVGRVAAELKRLTDMSGVAGRSAPSSWSTSRRWRRRRFTADADDIGKLAGAVSDVRIRPVHV